MLRRGLEEVRVLVGERKLVVLKVSTALEYLVVRFPLRLEIKLFRLKA